MNYSQSRQFLSSRTALGIKPGLERMRELAHRLGDPQCSLRIIHIAGTNGKGSVCSMISAALSAAGYKVGTYTSPYVDTYNEQIQINSVSISDEHFAELVTHIAPHVHEMDRQGNAPTEYEIITAAAFLYFEQQKTDFAVIEVGLGGLLDATNIIEAPLLSVITSISTDHTDFLGNTIEEISAHKAGIIKHNCPVVLSCRQDERAVGVIEQQCIALNAPLTRCHRDSSDVSLTLDGTFATINGASRHIAAIGLHQYENALTAITALEAIKDRYSLSISDDAVNAGLLQSVRPARFEVVSRTPPVIVDGAHNKDAALALKNNLEALGLGSGLTGVFGILRDKAHSDYISILAPLFSRIYLAVPNSPRALDMASLFTEVSRYTSAVPCESIEQAVTMAYSDIDRAMLIFGSLYLARDARPIIKELIK